MLAETNQRYGNTSWHWLADSDHMVLAGRAVDPFDFHVGQGAGRSAFTYLPDAGGRAVVRTMHWRVLGEVRTTLPYNGQILAREDPDVEDDLFDMPKEHKAVMNEHGPAEPVAAFGNDARVGTDAVATCVAVLARQRTDEGWRVGCSHLNADDEYDMGTFTRARTSIENLLARLEQAGPGTNAGPVQLYVVGGRDDPDHDVAHYARVIAAAQTLAHERAHPAVQLAGAALPANQLNCALAVHISAAGVVYTSVESSHSSDSDD